LNALGLVKIGENWGKIGEGIIGFCPQANSILNDCAKIHQILFNIATTGAMTDTQTPAVLLSVPCYAIAMGAYEKHEISDKLSLDNFILSRLCIGGVFPIRRNPIRRNPIRRY